MSRDLVIETNGKPTPTDRAAWTFAFLGGTAGSVASLFLPGGVLVAAAVKASAAAIGYFSGKKIGENTQQEELNTNQKQVSEPSYLNYKMLKNWFIGSMVGSLGGYGLAKLGVLALGAGIPVLPALLAGAALVCAFGAPIYGIVSGAIEGKKEMTVEYNQAQDYLRSRAQQHAVSQQRTVPEIEHEVPQRTQSHLQEQMARRANAAGIQKT